jgi:hypothetical protein
MTKSAFSDAGSIVIAQASISANGATRTFRNVRYPIAMG